MSSTFSARSPEGYERLMGRWSRHVAPKFLQFAPVSEGDEVIDVGCGTGSLTRTILAQARPARVVGIDMAEHYVAFAREQIPDPRVRFEVGDACALPFPDASFDRALSLLVLHFVPEAQRAVAEMRRVVRPGGTVAACVWDGYGGMPHMRMLWDTAGALGLGPDHRHFRPMSAPGEMAATWTGLGLREVEQSTVAIRFEFANFEDYWGPFTSGDGPAGQLVMGLSEADRARLEAQVRKGFESQRPDGPRSFAAEAWVCRGTVP
jgi:SAM-dependent methyltransferase